MEEIKKVKKIKSILLIIFVTVLFMIPYVYAASLSVTTSASSIQIGKTATITIKATGLAGRFSITSSNPSVATVNKSSEWLENNSIKVTVTAKSAGSTVITVKTVDVANTSTGAAYTATKPITITVKPKTTTQTPPPPTTGTTKPTVSSNAYLKEFRISEPGMKPSFKKTTYNYSVNVPTNVKKINVTAIPESSKATVVVTGNTNLKEGENTIKVIVTAQDKKTKKVYKITVNKANNPEKSNAYLDNLIVENAKLTTSFTPETLNYTTDQVSNEITSLVILAFPQNKKAKVSITGNNLKVGDNKVKVTVTSENVKVKKTYSISVNRSDEIIEPNEIQPYEDIVPSQNTIYTEEKLDESDTTNMLIPLISILGIGVISGLIYWYLVKRGIIKK